VTQLLVCLSLCHNLCITQQSGASLLLTTLLDLTRTLSIACLLLAAPITLQTESELAAQGASISDLEKAIADQNAPLALAEDRLAKRLNRPKIELVRDSAHSTFSAHPL
jgi:hypothetical protein